MPNQTECASGIRSYAAGFPPRYDRIFTTRPGYPLFIAPFVALFGERGMAMATAVLGVGAGVLMALGVRLLGGSLVQSLFATTMLFLLPTGYWLTRLLAESGAIAGTLAALCGGVLVLRNDGSRLARTASGGLTLVALLALTLVKPASGVLLAAGMAAAAVLIGAHDLIRRRRIGLPVRLLGAIAVTVLVLWQVMSAIFDIPGAEETLQDKFTASFTLPDVPDPWSRLLDMNRAFWPLQIDGWLNGGAPFAASPFLAFLVAGTAALCWAASGRLALLWLAAGGTGVLSVVAHPVASEVDRLLVFIWLPVAAGLALALRRPERATRDVSADGAGERHQ
jgi:4-amino-4-deoxy-L-arabinose transferase-like glycosyltransferase